MNIDKLAALAAATAVLSVGGGASDALRTFGVYDVVCLDANGDIKWQDRAVNLVTDVGARHLLDSYLTGAAFTATCIMGLKGAGAIAVGDTMASHATWPEVGLANAPQYTAPRKTVTFSAASGAGANNRVKASSSTQTFNIVTNGGTVDGAFLCINGTTVIDNTTGVLFSVGTFAGGARVVAVSDTLTVTYSLTI